MAAVCLCLLAACADEQSDTIAEIQADQMPPSETRGIERPPLSTMMASSPSLSICGTPVEMALTNGRHTPGKVSVSNDGDNLYVTYTSPEDGWYISDTRLAVVRTVAQIPSDGRWPNPWVFPTVGEHDPPSKSVTHTLSLAKLGFRGGDEIVIAAMAGAVHPKTSNWSGDWEWVVLWGLGNIKGKKVESIHNYKIVPCASTTPTQPPPPAPSGGVITITFDDGWLTTYTNAYPVLKKYGLLGNIAINPEPIDGSWADYLTLAQVREMNNAGWTVVSHSVSHADLTKLTAAQLDNELKLSKDWIAAKGLKTANVFIVPFHSWGPRELSAIKQYYGAARGYSINQFWPERFETWPPKDPYMLAGFEPEYASFTTADGRAVTMDYVERAVKNGEYLDLFFHRITDAQLPAFDALMQEVAQYKGNVRSFGEIF